jgi:outer membrane murein-binding lipoprotein Lpp
MKCPICGEKVHGNAMKKHLATHVEPMSKEDENSALAALKHDFEEMARAFKAIQEENAQLKANKPDPVEGARQVEAIRQAIPQRFAEAKAMFEAEEQVPYTAGEEGLDMTINGYRVYVPPCETKDIPRSFLMAIKRNNERAKQGRLKAQLIQQMASSSKYDEWGGSHFALEQVLRS